MDEAVARSAAALRDSGVGVGDRVAGLLPNVPETVIAMLAISLVESLFILPAHLGHQKERRAYGVFGWLQGLQQRFSRGFLRGVAQVYRPLLERILVLGPVEYKQYKTLISASIQIGYSSIVTMR